MNRHVPHLLVPGPWDDAELAIGMSQAAHLTRVLRMEPGDPLTYTDGVGSLGEGTLGERTVRRGQEGQVERPSTLHMAVAPLRSKDRTRFLVEKLQELGVARLTWLECALRQGRVPRPERVHAWAEAGLEQSRGAWLLDVDGPVALADLDGIVVCDPSGEPTMPPGGVLCVGPEGGWGPDEIPEGAARLSLGPTVLRTETAGIAAAVLAISGQSARP